MRKLRICGMPDEGGLRAADIYIDGSGQDHEIALHARAAVTRAHIGRSKVTGK
jgi:hypothetical protein